MAFTDTLKAKYGGVPLYVWGCGAVLLGAGFIVWRRRGKAGAAAAAPTGSPYDDYLASAGGGPGGVGSGSGGYSPSGGSFGSLYPQSPSSQQQASDQFSYGVAPASSSQFYQPGSTTMEQMPRITTETGAPISPTTSTFTSKFDIPYQLPQYAGTDVGYVTPRFEQFYNTQPTAVQDYLRSIAAK